MSLRKMWMAASLVAVALIAVPAFAAEQGMRVVPAKDAYRCRPEDRRR